MIRYRLKNELPNLEAGVIFEYDSESKMYKSCMTDVYGKYTWYEEQVFLDRPSWFDVISEEPKEVFTLDDEKAKEFYTFCYNNVFKQPTYPEEMIERFKQSKTPPVQSKPDTSKERIDRIEVTDVIAAGCSDNGNWYRFHIARSPGKPWPEIPKVNFPLIKRAIEDTLNGIPTPPFINYSLDHKFTQQDLDKVREQTWEAARQTHPLVAGMRYLTLESYLQTIKK